MHVRVDESWDDRPSTKVDDAGLRSRKTADFRAGTDRADSFPRKTNRFSRRRFESPVRTFAPTNMRSA